MRYRSSFSIIALMMLLLVAIPGARAHDESKYPNWKGQWSVILTPGLAGQRVKFDPTKPWGRGQEAPLTAEYQKVHEDSMADQAEGGLGNYPTATCHPGGMPRMMSTGQYEYVIESETTYILTVMVFAAGQDIGGFRLDDIFVFSGRHHAQSKPAAPSRAPAPTTRPGCRCTSTISRCSKSVSISTRPTRTFFMT